MNGFDPLNPGAFRDRLELPTVRIDLGGISSAVLMSAILNIQLALDSLSALVNGLWETVTRFLTTNWLWGGIINALRSALEKVKEALGRIAGALRQINLLRIWQAIRRNVERLRRLLDWYQKHVLEPIDRIRRQILDIYRRFFKPILYLLDSFRVMLRIVAVFNRRLAAKLDSRLLDLERKVMFPITASLRRLNELTSQVRAIITSLGLLERTLFLETLRRDAALVWEVLLNPRRRTFPPASPATPYTYHNLRNDVQLYVQTGAGPVGDYVRLAREAVRETLLEVA